MKLQEKHKQFVVRCYAQFMEATEITNIFMEEFQHDLHKICPINEEKIVAYAEKHGFPVTELEIDLYAEYQVETSDPEILAIAEFIARDEYRDSKKKAEDAKDVVYSKLIARFRRLNITHSQFPEKYRELFNETRERYLQNYRSTDLAVQENIVTELSTLYQLTKELTFKKRDLKYIAQAVQILKAIATCNAINDAQQPIDITPQDTKELQDTTKTLTNQLKKETKQLKKHKEKQNA